jgi:hypothetical protein
MRQGVYLSKGSSTRDFHILIVTSEKMSLFVVSAKWMAMAVTE